MAKKRQSAEQTRIPGTERLDSNPRIEKQAEEVRALCEQRLGLQEEEGEARGKLQDIMRDEGKTRHVYEGPGGELLEAVLDEGEPKVSVRKVKAKKAEAA